MQDRDEGTPIPTLPPIPPPPPDLGPPDHAFSLAVPGPIARAWALHSDTAHLNIAAGLDAYEYRDEPQPDGTTRRFFVTHVRGLTLEGEEAFTTWENERWFELRRSYSRGPLLSSMYRVTVEPNDPHDDEAGCTITHAFWIAPHGLLGRILRWGFAREIMPAMRRVLEEAARSLEPNEEDAVAFPSDALPTHQPKPSQIARVESLARDAEAMSPEGGVGRLAALLLRAPDDEVQRLRPHALARRWGMRPQDVVDGCLSSTHVGLLNLRWDAICPHCRGSKEQWTKLDAVQDQGFCSSCNLRFDIDLDRSLEAVFTPHPQVREVEAVTYCLGGPATTSHVLYQRMLEPGEDFEPVVRLPAGRHRLRVTGFEGFRWITSRPGEGPTGGRITIGEEGLEGEDFRVRPDEPARVVVQNRASRRALVVIEDVRWADDALPAGELVASQRFRDLFSQQMLRPGISLAVQSVTILFTDLVGSTAMYEEIGDAAAFDLVWTHFDILTDIVQEHRGTIVKTIGDAIMAAFIQPDDAMHAASELHDRVEAYVQKHGHTHPCKLKVGLHEGPAIVVRLNDRLDYFGGTINLAARVEGQSQGEDIVITGHVARRTDDCAALRAMGWHSEDFFASLRGLQEDVLLLRFRRITHRLGADAFAALESDL